MNRHLKHLISIVGPTAVGKTKLSLLLAQTFGTEILSTDARQIYRGLDIGTAKASPEEQALVPHHLIDFLDPNETFNAGQFETLAEAKVESLLTRYNKLISVGGSTLYINALWNGIDPMPEVPDEVRAQLQDAWQQSGLEPLLEELRAVDPETFRTIDLQNPSRVLRALEVYRASSQPISFFRKGKSAKVRTYTLWKIGLREERKQLYARIDQRVLTMMKAGLLEEVQGLLDAGYAPEGQAMQSIGYRELIQYLQKKISLDEAIALIQRNSRRYAKRQMTWFRRDPEIQWFPAGAEQEVLDWLAEKMASSTD